jgi:hypothetical protein
MKKTFSQINSGLTMMLVVTAMLSLTSCKKKLETPTIADWVTNRDAVSGLEVQYPKGWLINADPKSTKIYSSQIVSSKFYDVYTAGTTTIGNDEGGVEFEIKNETFADAQMGTLEAYKSQFKQTYDALKLDNEQPAVIGKDTGVSYSFKVKVGKDTDIEGMKMIVAHDSAFYVVSVTGFNDYYQVYKPILDKMIASIKLPKPKVKSSDPNAVLWPSADLVKYTNDLIEFEHPDNIEVTSVAKKGGALLALHMEVRDGRKDCTIDIEGIPTKTDKGEVKFDKFVSDNKGKYKPKSTGTAKVDGVDAKMLLASPTKDVDRKVLFIPKGEKIFTIILTWYKPMAQHFQPAFEKVVESIKLK